ncbi:ArsR/SmtB family transcription factor [Limisalsivibrio acetivorans]|uniref:ArsR/SmtB family transcription factor n=1 Tax=Limisalsivibrio acetivorans TaxID=1304888 RepID=UPI0003B7B6AF|nr:metalloregulator ArsR/SmtB family transcription factor [Limisalsivibrio acetivorans]
MALRDCNEEEIDNLLELFKALSNPLRLRIAREICKNPKYSFELEELFNCDRSNITKHLNILKDAGVIKPYKEGRKTLYVMQAKYVKSLLNCLDQERYLQFRKEAEEQSSDVI